MEIIQLLSAKKSTRMMLLRSDLRTILTLHVPKPYVLPQDVQDRLFALVDVMAEEFAAEIYRQAVLDGFAHDSERLCEFASERISAFAVDMFSLLAASHLQDLVAPTPDAVRVN